MTQWNKLAQLCGRKESSEGQVRTYLLAVHFGEKRGKRRNTFLLQEKLQGVVDKLLSEIQTVYGGRLISLAIFGSVGRGIPGFDSDIDFLIVARDLPAGRMKRIREFDRVEND